VRHERKLKHAVAKPAPSRFAAEAPLDVAVPMGQRHEADVEAQPLEPLQCSKQRK